MLAGKIILSTGLSFYYYLLVFKQILTPISGLGGRDFLSSVNLIIHEAGHFLFYPVYAAGNYDLFAFSTELYILGGSLIQWLVPAVFVGYFVFKKHWFASFVILFWFGQSLLSSVAYIADARAQRLPLLANGLIHDWNFLLSDWGLIFQAGAIADVVKANAFTILTISLVGVWTLTITSIPKVAIFLVKKSPTLTCWRERSKKGNCCVNIMRSCFVRPRGNTMQIMPTTTQTGYISSKPKFRRRWR